MEKTTQIEDKNPQISLGLMELIFFANLLYPSILLYKEWLFQAKEQHKIKQVEWNLQWVHLFGKPLKKFFLHSQQKSFFLLTKKKKKKKEVFLSSHKVALKSRINKR